MQVVLSKGMDEGKILFLAQGLEDCGQMQFSGTGQ